MRKLTLLTSVLLTAPFAAGNVSAQCMNTINCQTLGYTKTSCTKGGVKCPTGNYWYCPESQCDSSYKYTCTGAYQSPSGTACNGKYQKCNCSNNYIWNSSQGLCLADSGSGSSQCKLGGMNMSVGDMTCRSTSTLETDSVSYCSAGDQYGNGYTVPIAPVVSTSACVAGVDAGIGNIQMALDICSNLNFKGVTGWYLPSQAVLAAIDKEYGLNGTYWSSSQRGSSYYLPYNGPSVPDPGATYIIFCVHDLPG